MKPVNFDQPLSNLSPLDGKLFGAVMSDDPEAMAVAIAEGADINATDLDDYTPLITAVQNHKVEAVAFLLRSPGIDVEHEDNLCGMTAEQHAAYYPEESPVRQAFKEFHLARTYHNDPYFSFLTACAKGDLPVVEAGLLSPYIKGLLNNKDRFSQPLLNAVRNGSPACVRLLLEAGADPDIENHSQCDNGLTPPQVAKKNPEISKLLEEYDGKRVEKADIE